jgi:hypothetical protein
MCYSAEVSLQTFLFVAAISGFLFLRNSAYDRPIAGILFIVSLMQLVEYGLWKNLDCGPTNKLLTLFVNITIVLQPLLVLLIVWSTGSSTGKYISTLIVIYCISLPYLAYRMWKNYGLCSTVSEGSHLRWGGYPNPDIITNILYYTSLTYPLITFKDRFFAISYVGAGILTLWYSLGQYKTVWPSLWCHSVNAMALLALMRPI